MDNSDFYEQLSLGIEPSPAQQWDADATRRALDELFSVARQYNSSQAYLDLMKFVAGFRFYAPFNAMLVHVQMAGATFVAPPGRWRFTYGRRIKPDARPLVILQPMGPVMFVFDVSGTEPLDGAPDLPPEVLHPFQATGESAAHTLQRTITNAVRDGVEVFTEDGGSQSAGSIRTYTGDRQLSYLAKRKPQPQYEAVRVRYTIMLNANHAPTTRYATLVHELAHLYCGHLGTPDERWWPDRRGLSHAIREFEAESVSYLVCCRLGIETTAAAYLANYCTLHQTTPPVSLDCVMKAAGLIETMGSAPLPPRKAHLPGRSQLPGRLTIALHRKA